MLFAALSSLVLATACSDGDTEPQEITTCGSDPVYVSLKGRVTDSEGEPVHRIQVAMIEYLYMSCAAVAYTDENGEFAFVRRRMFSAPAALLFRDVDGVANGVFEDRLDDCIEFVRSSDYSSDSEIVLPDVEVQLTRIEPVIVEGI